MRFRLSAGTRISNVSVGSNAKFIPIPSTTAVSRPCDTDSAITPQTFLPPTKTSFGHLICDSTPAKASTASAAANPASIGIVPSIALLGLSTYDTNRSPRRTEYHRRP